MASTYSPNLRIELIGSGEQSGTWDDTTNTNLGTLLEESISGVSSVVFATDADHTLSTANGSTDEARQAVLSCTSTGSLTATRDLICPTSDKVYIVYNNTTGSQSIRIKTSAGTGITVSNGLTALVYCDGTNVVDGLSHLPSSVAIGTMTIASGSINDSSGAINFGNENLSTSGSCTFSGGGSLTGTWTDLGTASTIDINGGTVDGTVVGGGTAAAGSFTTLGASGNVTFTGGTINGIAIGGTTAAAGAFTTVSGTTATFTGAISGTTGAFSSTITINGTTSTYNSGTGSPESSVTAPVGSIYTRTDGGASTTLYVKETGTGNTGWAAFGATSGSSLPSGGTVGQFIENSGSGSGSWSSNMDDVILGATSPAAGTFTTLTGTTFVGLPASSTSAAGIVQLTDSTSTTSSVLAASATAVKAAKDAADAAGGLPSGGTVGQIIENTGSGTGGWTSNLDDIIIGATTPLAANFTTLGTSGTATFGAGLTTQGDIVANLDSLRSIGSTSVRFLKVWTDTTAAGTLLIGAGSITDSSGAISFGNENISTTGTLASGALSVTGAMTSSTTITATTSIKGGSCTVAAGSITDTSGAISFGNENISTTGTLASGALSVTGSISVTGTVDGRDIAADGTKLNTIATNADVTGSNTASAATNIILGATTSVDTTCFPVFAATASTAAQTPLIDNVQLTYNASTAIMTAVDFSASSDRRLKSNIETMKLNWERFGKYRPVLHEWIEEFGPEGVYPGLIAQEVEEINPALVVPAGIAGNLSITYSKLIPELILHIQDLNKRIEKLEKA